MSFINALPPVAFLAIAAVYFIIAAVVAVAVFNDARRRESTFVSLHPLWWAASIAFLSPIIGLGIYWLVHYSTLSSEPGTPEVRNL